MAASGLGSESRDLRHADSHRRVKVPEGSEERNMEEGGRVVRFGNCLDCCSQSSTHSEEQLVAVAM